MFADGSKRVCLLTGATGVLGTDFCTRFADRYSIAAVYRSHPPSVPSQETDAVDPLDPTGRVAIDNRRVFAIQGDVTSEADNERIVEATLAKFGRIDLVVHAAVHSVWGPMIGSDPLRRSGHKQFATNVLAPLNLSLVVARRYWASHQIENRILNRNIVNVSSVAGLRLYSGLGQSLYASSKAALNHLTVHMAAEFGAIGVRVNATAPNSFPSVIPTSRVTDSIICLDGSSETGVVVVVDGSEDRSVTLDRYT